MKESSDNQLRIERCKSFYQDFFNRQAGPFAHALEATLHIFLNGSPSNSSLTIRINGLIQASFWLTDTPWPDTPVLRFALSQMLRSEPNYSEEFFQALIKQSPPLLGAAIRYAQLARSQPSPLYSKLKSSLIENDWRRLFAHYDSLITAEYSSHQQLNAAEKKLRFLQPFEFTFYLSMVMWDILITESLQGEHRDVTSLCELILSNKFKASKAKDFILTEASITESFSRHFKPLLSPFPLPPQQRQQAWTTYELMKALVAAAQNWKNQRGELNRFCFEEVCHVFKPTADELESSNFSDAIWQRTDQKMKLFYHYWLQRGMTAFVNSGLDLFTIAKPEQEDAIWLAWTKTYATLLQLEALFGVTPQSKLTDHQDVSLLELVRFIELSASHFTNEYTLPLLAMRQQGASTQAALSNLMVQGLVQGENRNPITWAKISEKSKRMQDWFKSDNYPEGNPAAAKAALMFWSLNTQDFTLQDSEQGKEPARIHEKQLLKFGEYIIQIPFICDMNQNCNALINQLRRYNSRRQELKEETEAAEHHLANMLRNKGLSVIVGYQPAKVLDEDNQEVDAGEIDLEPSCLAFDSARLR